MGLACDIGGASARQEAETALELFNRATNGEESAWHSLARLEDRVNSSASCGSPRSFAESVYEELRNLSGSEGLVGSTRLHEEKTTYSLPNVRIDLPEKPEARK
jgi:hypothetical protein